MKTKIILLLASLFSSLYTIPCGNSYRAPAPDVYTKGNTLEVFRFREKFDQHSLLEELQKLGDAIKSSLNLFEDENDKALTYMRMGAYDKALDILLRLEKEKPTEYNIIANLGTLYELRGENEKALAYIRRAVAIDNQSHHGSEWFHIQILEAKLLKKDAGWWRTHHVLNLSLIKKEPETVISDITYQLKERLPFTPKPDIMMASILEQTGDYLQSHSKQQQAWIIYKISMEYDKDGSPGETKMKNLEKYFSTNNIRRPDYSAHFIKTDELLETGKQLLGKGIDLYNDHQEKIEKEKEQAKNVKKWLFIIGGSLIMVLLLVFFFFRKKTAV